MDVTAGETKYGSTDLSADFTQNTLYYSDVSLWRRAASVEELEANDEFQMALEKYAEFEEQLRQEEALQRE